MLERELERKFREAVRDCGGETYKFVSPGTAGVPDRLVVLPGGCIGFIELKQEGKVPTRLQKRQIQKLKDLGCAVCVLDHPKDILRAIEFLQAEAGGRQL